jgi:hypothetical protein
MLQAALRSVSCGAGEDQIPLQLMATSMRNEAPRPRRSPTEQVMHVASFRDVKSPHDQFQDNVAM